MKSVIFDSSSQLGGQNIPDLDLLTSLVHLKIDFAERAIEIKSEIADIQFTIDEFQRRTDILRNTSKATLDNEASSKNALDVVVTCTTLNFLSMGKQIYFSLSKLMNVAAYIQQENDFLSRIQSYSPLSTPEEFRKILKLLRNELNAGRIVHSGIFKYILDETYFPSEFELQRSSRSAKFPIFDEKNSNIWIENIQAILNNVSSDGKCYMTSLENSGSKLFDFGDELKLEHDIFENVFKNPGLEWIIEVSTMHNNVELINYPFHLITKLVSHKTIK